jgi:hypothetical protein
MQFRFDIGGMNPVPLAAAPFRFEATLVHPT